jgi:hypothetical protein
VTALPDAMVAVEPAAADTMTAAIEGSRGVWTLEENTKLTHAIKTTRKKKCGEEYRTDWVAVSALVPG